MGHRILCFYDEVKDGHDFILESDNKKYYKVTQTFCMTYDSACPPEIDGFRFGPHERVYVDKKTDLKNLTVCKLDDIRFLKEENKIWDRD